MRKILSLIIVTVFANAHWLEDIPQTITQSNGQTIQCFASGDQYAHRLHDKDDYTILLNPVDGDFYYAEKVGEKIRSHTLESKNFPIQVDMNFECYQHLMCIDYENI